MRSAGEQRLPGPHPVAVAGQGVDLAVVGQVAVGVGQRPRLGKVLVEKREWTRARPLLEPLVGQVGEELGQLVRR